MFKKKTVFVIGAGGSNDFGLPLGEELKGLIAEAVNVKIDHFGRPNNSSNRHFVSAVEHLNASPNGQRGQEAPYWQAAEDTAAGLPSAFSIDNFLETHSQNHVIQSVGKLGIAHAILTKEAGSKLRFDRTNINNKLDISQLNHTWFLEFAKLLLLEVKRGDTSSFANVEIVTFNYDRCIEESLAYYISSLWILPIEEARIAAEKIKVTHVYGTVGLLPWQTGEGYKVQFGAELSGTVLNQSASMLRTFGEKIETNTIEQEVLTKIAASERIVFIGFSFMRINLKYFTLGFSGSTRDIFATAMGLSQTDKEMISEELIDLSLRGATGFRFMDATGDKLIQAYGRLLMS